MKNVKAFLNGYEVVAVCDFDGEDVAVILEANGSLIPYHTSTQNVVLEEA